MNIGQRLKHTYERLTKNTYMKNKSIEEKSFSLTDNFDVDYFYSKEQINDPYLIHSWVNIAVSILIRNIARADFVIKKGGDDVVTGHLYDLFRRPNPTLNSYDLWKETAGWWFLQGEAFWWYGPDYSSGVPKEIFILDPRRMISEILPTGGIYDELLHRNRRWFYQCNGELVPILSDELIQFKEWNPWDSIRGVNPLIALSLEIQQDYYANKTNTNLLRNNAVPQGILKSEQSLRPEEADAIERRWESKYGSIKAGRKIAVIGKGTDFKPITFSPDVIKLFELKKWNLYTILGKFGIPPRVANIFDKTTALSGKDTAEQHSAFWKYTLIPILRQFEKIVETKFFINFNLQEKGIFDLSDIPELQESEDAQSKRDIAEINAGLKTINEVLRERGKEPKPWGDVWYRPKNIIATNGNKE